MKTMVTRSAFNKEETARNEAKRTIDGVGEIARRSIWGTVKKVVHLL
jgi:hypothetical protein